MYKVYDIWPQIAREQYETDLNGIDFGEISHVVFAGMGGSGAISDIFSAILSKTNIHVEVIKGYLLPKTVDSKSLVITTSISGNTEETLSVLTSASDLKCKVVAFSDGGKMQKYCTENGLNHRKVSMKHSPRASFPAFLFSIIRVLEPFLPIKKNDIIDSLHKRMLSDLKRYTKFFALEKNAPNSLWASKVFSRLMHKCGIKTKQMSAPVSLELAKIVCDTSYYGWLINYAQISNMIARKHMVDYNEMWSFADEIHKFLGNRPKMFPGFIGGHCVVPNLSLIDEKELWQIDKINNIYAKKVKDAKLIAKKFVKGKRS